MTPRDSLLSACVLALSICVLVAAGPRLALAEASSAPPAVRRGEVSAGPPAPGERALEGQLLAPCCYTQTLDLHESDAARELRLEIRRRLYAGESVEAIERSLMARYGERLRAAPAKDPMQVVAPAMLVVAGLAGISVLQLLRRWRRRSQRAVVLVPLPAAAADAYDELLDAELRDID
jgi:cytochrome c-type biogenesis protein CcmH